MRSIKGKSLYIPIYAHFRFINLKYYINRKLSLEISKDISKHIRIIVLGKVVNQHNFILQSWDDFSEYPFQF